jgi:hypothetical protein
MSCLVAIGASFACFELPAAAFEVDFDGATVLDSMDFTSSRGSTGTEADAAAFLERTGNAKLHPFGAVFYGIRPYGKLGLGELPGKKMGRSSQVYDRISNASLDRDSGVVMRFGAGADLPLGKSWSLQAGVGYDHAVSEEIDGYEALTATGGVTLRW